MTFSITIERDTLHTTYSKMTLSKEGL